MLAEQAEFLKATNHELGHWQLLRDLDGFVSACVAAVSAGGEGRDRESSYVAIYVETRPEDRWRPPRDPLRS